MKQSSEHKFTAPLDGVRNGRLILAPGAGGVRIEAGETQHELCRVDFKGCVPAVRAEGGVVTIRYRSLPAVSWLGHRQEPRAAIRLNGAIPWEIELRGSLSELVADLAGLALRSLDLNSNTGQVQIRLPEPLGTVYVQAGGTTGSLVLRRPDGVAFRVQMSGSGRLACDGKALVATPGGMQWQTPDYAVAGGRYDVRVSGQIGELIVSTW